MRPATGTDHFFLVVREAAFFVTFFVTFFATFLATFFLDVFLVTRLAVAAFFFVFFEPAFLVTRREGAAGIGVVPAAGRIFRVLDVLMGRPLASVEHAQRKRPVRSVESRQ